VFGHVPGVGVGTLFEDRQALRAAGVHRPTQAGICGRADVGAESVVLNGGYVDDEDLGDVVVYTGAGGNDRQSGRQIADQTLARTNRALVENIRRGLPVRVVRGARGDHDPPASGYRYDGLYRVADYWAEAGRDGYRIWRFRLERLADDEARPDRVSEQPELFDTGRQPERRDMVVSRIVRDTAVTREVKQLYEFRCQVCGERVETPTGPYAEAAHVTPLGRPHDGPDTLANVLCLCPTHHAAFDLYAFAVADDLGLIGEPGRLRVHPEHPLDLSHLRGHRHRYEAAHDTE